MTTRRCPLPAAALLGLFAGPAAFGQQAVIDRCRATSSDADRIACLEAALLGREAAKAPAAPAPAAAAPAPPQAAPAAPVPDDAVVEAEPEPTGIGAGQVIARSQSAAERRSELESATDLRISAYDYVPYRRLVVTLENGQVWRQIEGDTRYVRVDLDRNQTADISESALGGYRLRLNEIRRTIRVERVR